MAGARFRVRVLTLSADAAGTRTVLPPSVGSGHGWRIGRIEVHAHPASASAKRMEDETPMDDLTPVRHRATLFGVLRPEALSPRASRDLIRKAEEEPDGEA
ncbi:hypothetical protein SUDANB67_03859 [Nocardiopsis dassonvillei]